MTETTALPPTDNPSAPLFVRPHEGRVLTGVCAGIAQRWHLDVTLVRIVTAVLTLASGVGAVAYVVAWLLTPSVDGPAPLSAGSPLAASMHRHGGLWRRLAQVVLVVIVAAVLLGLVHNLWFGIPMGLVIVAAGVALLFGTRAGRWVFASLAVLLVLALTTVGVLGSHFGSRSFHVTSVDDLRSSYDYGVGRVALDLSALTV